MHLRHLFSSRLRGSLLLGSLLVASSFSTQAAEEMLRKAVGKGAYEMAYSQQENALWLATSQSRKLDKGGVVYRLDPVTLEVTQAIHNDLKPFGATINNTTQTLWFGNTVNSAVTAIDAKTGEVKGRLVLDERKRTEEVRPLQPRELVADDATNTVYISGIGKESVIWVVDGENIKLKTAIQNTGKMSTGLALDSKGKRLYTTNADGELITIDTADNKILSRKKLLDDGKEHFFINISLDTARQRAFITDSKAAEVLVVDTRNGNILAKVAAPESLAVLFNPARNEAYVTHRQAGKVSVIDAKSYKVVKTFDTPTHPNSLALSTDGKTLYVSVKQKSTKQQEATQPDDVIRIAL
ncbi:TPA: YncE family protein [Escherichia fergusonii]|uniref:7-bladed beta-propeller protein YncE n=1 Tax=Escherichia fergusonii TaxID=564 RepID=UPI0001FB6389|nr:YncE family protein [Escherichia fergusonii]EFL4508373.1 YncE family protein [Escherichia fergusonii]EFL4514002.1 YncE family protein [Escherichia fergusonii]EFN0216086.1 YncE family protein [Escherichia fergusonii]EFO7692358.1 YncE family protein [Escherichia fergusonii]EGC07338.1 TN family protein beta-propeller [Escherichia fergusonii B253]